ncbi:MAG: hypothetical protein KAJ36_05645 [Candidatus Thorarchaeota archaeon]|nr:hypothetical protein [Candidatus Thorarchaeota archaeon]
MGLMCAAHEDIDKIHESEMAARERIEDAEKHAREIREEADKEAKSLMAKAEQDAKKAASKKLSKIEGEKSKIESSMFEKMDLHIEDIRKTAIKRKDEAEKAVYKILVGEK